MILANNIARTFRFLRILPLLAGIVSAGELAIIPAPTMVPQGRTGWVGSTTAAFKSSLGRIYYTLDGSTPTTRSYQYREGTDILIEHSLTLKGIQVIAGSPSNPVVGQFLRAKLPAPTARYGGHAEFHPTVLCTLQVVRDGAKPEIRYTLDGSPPGPGSNLYTAPIKLAASTVVRAYAVDGNDKYDDSEPMQAAFTLLEPVSVPVATPGGRTFSTNTLIIKLKTATSGAYFRYTLDPGLKSLDTASIVSGDSLSIAGGEVGDTTILRVQAFKTGYPSSPVLTEKYLYLPAVAMPAVSRPSGYFYDTAMVAFSGPAGADIRYVTNGSVVTSSSLDGSTPVLLSASTTLKVGAFKPPQPPSAILTVAYTLRLSPPDFDKQSQQFVGSLDVRLTSKCPGAVIYYTLDGSEPTLQTGIPLGPDGIVTVSADETRLRAVAYKDGIFSTGASATYTKKPAIQELSAPIISPPSREFEDAIAITLSTADANAEIHYTTNGRDPTLADPEYVATPIHLDSTTVLRARSFPTAGNLESSLIVEGRYELTPSPPYATPTASAPYPNKVSVTLGTRTKNGVIKYVLGATPLALELATTYIPGNPIVIASTSRLQAVTVLTSGGSVRYSTPLDLTYEIYTSNPSDSLPAGTSRTITGGFVFANESTFPIMAKTHPTDGFALVGFKDASLAVTLQPVQAGQALKVSFTKPAGATASLYRYSAGGIEFITADTQKDLTRPGEYFLGVDTMPPAITLLDQSPKSGDATVLKLSITDNVGHPLCEIQSPGLSGGKATMKPDSSGELTVSLQLSGSDLPALWFRASSADFYNIGRLPADPAGKVYLTQAWSRVVTPAVLSLGSAVSNWDMTGFPIGGGVPLTWGQLRKDNPGPDLDAAVWNEGQQQYNYLEDSNTIKPGTAIWLGSRTSLSKVAVTGFQTAGSETDGTFRMTLHPGWNQVTSPSLDRVYWPVSVAASKSQTVYVKAPYEYVPELGDYVQCDSLKPWRGYFVHYFGNFDTVVTVYTDASKRPAAKVAAPAPEEGRSVDLKLDFGRPLPLSLAARAEAQDGIGAEDEPDLPALQRSFRAWSQRGRGHLLTDVVRFRAGEPLRWNIVVSDALGGNGKKGGNPAAGSFKVMEDHMPAGYEAWAVSARRGMRFRLRAGEEMPVAEMAGDTLTVLAGPLAKLSGISEFAEALTSVTAFSFQLQKAPEGRILRIALPRTARVEAMVWSSNGRLLAESRPGRLEPGIYRLPMASASGTGGNGSQVGFLRIRLIGENGSRGYSRKVIW